MYVHQTSDGDRYSFINLDASPDPGPSKGFNMFGLVKEVILLFKELNRLLSIQANNEYQTHSQRKYSIYFNREGERYCLFQNTMKQVDRFATQARRSSAVVWFGHYPVISMASPPPGIQSIIG